MAYGTAFPRTGPADRQERQAGFRTKGGHLPVCAVLKAAEMAQDADALKGAPLVTLRKSGKVDVARMAQLLGSSAATVR